MRCIECGKKMKIENNHQMEFKSKIVGLVMFAGLKAIQCKECHKVYLDYEYSKIVCDRLRNIESNAISKLPIKDFITLEESATILNKTEKEFKEFLKKYKFMFMFYFLGDNMYFYKPSVELYKNTSDGRIFIIGEEK